MGICLWKWYAMCSCHLSMVLFHSKFTTWIHSKHISWLGCLIFNRALSYTTWSKWKLANIHCIIITKGILVPEKSIKGEVHVGLSPCTIFSLLPPNFLFQFALASLKKKVWCLKWKKQWRRTSKCKHKGRISNSCCKFSATKEKLASSRGAAPIWKRMVLLLPFSFLLA